MKIVYVGLYRVVSSSQAWRLVCASHLVDFGYFTRSAIAQHIQFAARTVVERTQPGCRQTVQPQDEKLPFVAHTYVRSDGLAGVVMADKEYPVRVAFTLITKEMAAYEERVGVNWKKMDQDQPDTEPDFLKEDIVHYQASKHHTTASHHSQHPHVHPLSADRVPLLCCCAAVNCSQDPRKADKLTAIQTQLDEVKDVMHVNIEQLMQRGETLDSLMDKSQDLSQASVHFYQQSKRANSCCQY